MSGHPMDAAFQKPRDKGTDGLGLFAAGSQPVETSESAADALSAARLATLRRHILTLIASAGELGMTADEVTAAFGSEDHNSISPRVTELLQMGYLERLDGKDGRPSVRRETRKGGTAFVHRCTRSGLKQIQGAA